MLHGEKNIARRCATRRTIRLLLSLLILLQLSFFGLLLLLDFFGGVFGCLLELFGGTLRLWRFQWILFSTLFRRFGLLWEIWLIGNEIRGWWCGALFRPAVMFVFTVLLLQWW